MPIEIVHIVPNEDYHEHLLRSDCSCNPEMKVVASLELDDSGDLQEVKKHIISHSSFDGREELESMGIHTSKGWSIITLKSMQIDIFGDTL